MTAENIGIVKITIGYSGDDPDRFESKIMAIQGALFRGADYFIDPDTGENIDLSPLIGLGVLSMELIDIEPVSGENN